MSNEITGSNLNESDVNLNRNKEPENKAMHLKRHVPKNISPEPRSLFDVEEIPPYDEPKSYETYSINRIENTPKGPSLPFAIFTGMVSVLIFAGFLGSLSDDFGTQILISLLMFGALIIGVPAILISLISHFVKSKNDTGKSRRQDVVYGATIHKVFPYVAIAFLLSIAILILFPLLKT